jgi:methionyl-tRNA formyltransferase
MDAGPILDIEKVKIDEEMTFGELREQLCAISGPAVEKVLEKIKNKSLQKVPQNHTEATFAPKIAFEDRVIDWEKGAAEIHNQIRGLSPEPGALCAVEVKGQKKWLSIKKAKKITNLLGKPGSNLSYQKNEWIIACGTGAISLLEVQLEGKKSMSIEDFTRGNPQPLKLSVQ